MARKLGQTLALQSAVTGFGFAVAALVLAGDAPVVSNAFWDVTLVLFLLALLVVGLDTNDEE